MSSLWPLGLYSLIVVAVVALVLGLSALTGPRHSARRRDLPYESGMPATGGVQIRFPVAFYLIAIDFLIFDIEAAILFGWAGVAREVGWTGFFAAAMFIAILLVGLAWVWAKGGLDWGAEPSERRAVARRRPATAPPAAGARTAEPTT